jgi:hypothetical protein
LSSLTKNGIANFTKVLKTNSLWIALHFCD